MKPRFRNVRQESPVDMPESTPALIAIHRIEDEGDEPYLLGIYLWQSNKWISEDTGRALVLNSKYDNAYWIPESEVIALIDQAPDQLLQLAKRCESFISGFEGDELQEHIPELLGDLRTYIEDQENGK